MHPLSESATASDRLRRALADVSIISSCVFIATLASLHVLRPDLAPSWHFISDYEVGDYGWVMRVAFFSLAVSCAALLAALLPHARGLAGRLGLLLLGGTAAGLVLAGLFEPSTQNTLHETGAMLDQLPLAVLLTTCSLWRNTAWRSARPALVGAALVLLGCMAWFIAAMLIEQPSRDKPPSPDVRIGWPSRAFIVAHCAWLIPIAYHVRRLSASAGRRSGSAQ